MTRQGPERRALRKEEIQKNFFLFVFFVKFIVKNGSFTLRSSTNLRSTRRIWRGLATTWQAGFSLRSLSYDLAGRMTCSVWRVILIHSWQKMVLKLFYSIFLKN